MRLRVRQRLRFSRTGAVLEIPTIGIIIKIEGEVVVKEEGSTRITEEEVKTIFPAVDAGNGMAMS